MGQVCKGTLGPLCPFAPSPNPQPQKPRQCFPSAQITVALEVDIAERLKGVRAQLVEENMSHCPVTTLLLSSAFELLQAYTAFASIFPAIRSICEGVCVWVGLLLLCEFFPSWWASTPHHCTRHTPACFARRFEGRTSASSSRSPFSQDGHSSVSFEMRIGAAQVLTSFAPCFFK